MVLNPAYIPLIVAGIGAAGSIAGGLLGGKGGTGTANRKASRGQIRGAVQGANEAGLHPLAVLGGGYGGFPAPTSNPMGNAIANASRDVSQGIIQSANVKRGDKAASEQNALLVLNSASQRELQGAQADYWRAKTITEATTASQLTSVRNSPALRVSDVPDAEKRRYEIELYDRSGKFIGYIPDPEIMEGMEGLIPAGLAATSMVGSQNERNRRAPRRRKTYRKSGSPDYYGTP